jgi:hexokinase
MCQDIVFILGTGSNAAFVEYKDNIEKWDSCYKDDDPSDIVSSFDTHVVVCN